MNKLRSSRDEPARAQAGMTLSQNMEIFSNTRFCERINFTGNLSAAFVVLHQVNREDMRLKTTFEHNREIPEIYTCIGRNISPPCSWEDIPEGTQSLVLIFEDMDAVPVPWTHWLVFNIPVSTAGAEEGRIPSGGTEGLANNHTFGYEGPCPKYFKGTHHYRLSLYALNTPLHLPAASEKDTVTAAMEGRITGNAALTGLCTSA